MSASLPTRYPPTRALLPQRVCPVRGSKRATLQASINSFLLLSRNRSRLKTQKFAFHETRKVPCQCREIVITIRQVKCCEEKHSKTKLCNQLAGNHRHQQRRCRQTLAQFPFVSKSSAGSVHIACHSAARATLVTASNYLATLISLLGSSRDQWSSWANLARDDDTPTTTCHAEKQTFAIIDIASDGADTD
jgi:hypothetical protein